MPKTKNTRSLPTDTIVRFREGMRPPLANHLPEDMQVFISDSRVTTVLVFGKPFQIATVALEVVK
jgi:hypothetical protein